MINEHLYLRIEDIIEVKCKAVQPLCCACGDDCKPEETSIEDEE